MDPKDSRRKREARSRKLDVSRDSLPASCSVLPQFSCCRSELASGESFRGSEPFTVDRFRHGVEIARSNEELVFHGLVVLFLPFEFVILKLRIGDHPPLDEITGKLIHPQIYRVKTNKSYELKLVSVESELVL